MENKTKNTLLQVASILMIIGGVLGLIMGVIALIASVAAIAVAGGIGLVLTVAAVVAVAGSVIQLVAGLKGKKSCQDPVLGAGCMTIGIVVMGIAVAGQVLTLVAGGDFSVTSLISSLLLPGLYVYAAYTDKQKLGQ